MDGYRLGGRSAGSGSGQIGSHCVGTNGWFDNKFLLHVQLARSIKRVGYDKKEMYWPQRETGRGKQSVNLCLMGMLVYSTCL